ncbi:MAG: uracil-DNA glycosylase [Janthinobacterium lividum]
MSSLFDDFEPPVLPPLPESWLTALSSEFSQPYWPKLQNFVAEERSQAAVYPPESDIYSAFQLTPLEDVRVFLLGQDPYHNAGQAHGLCFSVRPGVETPPSLVNIYKEMRDDLGIHIPNNGFLVPWAKQGVLMLNAVLTVRAHTANSHKNKGWETFTDSAIRAVSAQPNPVVFVLWGGYAQKKLPLIDAKRHTIIQSVHPSPLSARNGFFGSRPFSQINAALKSYGTPEIDWQIEDI